MSHTTAFLLPPKAHLCQTCGTEHSAELPHNPYSLYYGVAFKLEHDRSPSWHDAMAHCTEEVKQQWIEALKSRGIPL